MGDRDARAGNDGAVVRKSKLIIAGLALPIALGGLTLGWSALGTSRVPSTMQVVGYAGHLGEWELTATLAKSTSSGGGDLSGPLRMKHVGFCSKDGSDEKTGAIQIRLSRLSSNADVKLLIDGVSCSHSGNLSGSSIGTMSCPDRKAVPLMIWVK